jgi:hypothetical protein
MTAHGVTRQNQMSLGFLAQLGIGINGVAVLVLAASANCACDSVANF